MINHVFFIILDNAENGNSSIDNDNNTVAEDNNHVASDHLENTGKIQKILQPEYTDF